MADASAEEYATLRDQWVRYVTLTFMSNLASAHFPDQRRPGLYPRLLDRLPRNIRPPRSLPTVYDARQAPKANIYARR